jgi:hypothetical protein
MPRFPTRAPRLAAALVAAALAAPAAAQYKPASTCRFLTPEEAAAVIGAEAKLRSAIEDGACVYGRGPLTLTVQQPFTYSERKVVVQSYEAMEKSRAGTPLAGLGDRAFLAKGNSGYSIGILAGGTLIGLELYGEGSDAPEMAKKLEAAAQRVVDRL